MCGSKKYLRWGIKALYKKIAPIKFEHMLQLHTSGGSKKWNVIFDKFSGVTELELENAPPVSNSGKASPKKRTVNLRNTFTNAQEILNQIAQKKGRMSRFVPFKNGHFITDFAISKIRRRQKRKFRSMRAQLER